ncbi:MAG: hypothetical protein ACYCR3_08075 [Acidithiobacillus sp.]
MKIIRDIVKVGQRIVVGAIVVELLSFLIGSLMGFLGGASAANANAAFAISATVVGGGYWIYRKRHPRSDNGKFGEGLRGSEVEDHTDHTNP